MFDASWKEGGTRPDGRPMQAHQPGQWACLANPECRRNNTVVSIHSGSTDNATKHLRVIHNVTSKVTEAKQQRKNQEDQHFEDEQKESEKLKKGNPSRFHLLAFVKHLIIGCLLPFSLGQKEQAHLFFRHSCKYDDVNEMRGRGTYTDTTASSPTARPHR